MADTEVVEKVAAEDPVVDDGPTIPAPITPDTPTAAAMQRVAYERMVNDGAERFAADAFAAYIEHTVAGRTVALSITNVDGSDYDPDDDVTAAELADTDVAEEVAAGTPYADWTRDELADECRKRELPVSGPKDELIDRLEYDDMADAVAEGADSDIEE